MAREMVQPLDRQLASSECGGDLREYAQPGPSPGRNDQVPMSPPTGGAAAEWEAH